MRKNVGKMDRIVRIAIAVVLSILAYSKIIPGDFALGVYLVSGIIALTGFIRFCPLYKILHKSTCREEPPHFS
ncbi:YgaP family membrane protein [Aquirufa regiilacus]|uniref:YgaP family membrane protein n=1 Tax=Aquirufa regiilacus TaxID=3024868 RepID=UPI0028DF90BD|nr:DUF2892 domain-containing protein [Aquirufa sp. LEPPI-3A]MDT8887270.1 DUF2892 domain-containing protein [Aquirufa sp. LEPPI-3A]